MAKKSSFTGVKAGPPFQKIDELDKRQALLSRIIGSPPKPLLDLLEASIADSKAAREECAAKLWASVVKWREEWREATGEDPPTTLEQWEKEASRAGLSADAILLEGAVKQMTPQKLTPTILGYHCRLQDESDKASPVKKAAGFVSASDIAKELNLGKKELASLRNRLTRWRKEHAIGWMEVDPSERGPRDPKFLYRRGVIQSVIGKRKQQKT